MKLMKRQIVYVKSMTNKVEGVKETPQGGWVSKNKSERISWEDLPEKGR